MYQVECTTISLSDWFSVNSCHVIFTCRKIGLFDFKQNVLYEYKIRFTQVLYDIMMFNQLISRVRPNNFLWGLRWTPTVLS